MQVTTRNKIKEIELSTMWFDEDGVFCTVTKKDVMVTKSGLEETFQYIRENSPNDKVCWLGDVSDASLSTKEAQDYAAQETPKLVKALALITNSQLSRLMANIFLTLKKPPYPTRMFTNEQNAREWLKQYL